MELKNVPIEKVKSGVYDLRAKYDGPETDLLVGSIRRRGIINPITVAVEGDAYIVIAGHRRLYAAKMAGLETIPVVIRKAQDGEAEEVSLAENLMRLDMTPLEVACAVNDIIETEKMTVEKIAAALGRSSTWVRAQISMLTWQKDIQAALQEGWLKPAAAANLVLITDDAYREFCLRMAKENGVTARTTAAWYQAWRSQMPVEEAVQQPPVEANPLQPAVMPMAPCFACGNTGQNDTMGAVLLCVNCMNAINKAKANPYSPTA